MSEQVTLSEAARRIGVSRQYMHKASKEPDFPSTVKRGRSVLVDWPAVQRWRAERQAETEMRRKLIEHEREIRALRGRLWPVLRGLLGGMDAGLILRQAGYDELELRRLAVQYLVEACDD